jgi:uncharacterized protein with PIN domain
VIVDSKYKKSLVGRYNRSVTRCLECDFEIYKSKEYGTIFDNIIGFNEAYIGLVAIWECPVCFEKWYYHGYDHYDYFLDSIDNGTNKFFKN